MHQFIFLSLLFFLCVIIYHLQCKYANIDHSLYTRTSGYYGALKVFTQSKKKSLTLTMISPDKTKRVSAYITRVGWRPRYRPPITTVNKADQGHTWTCKSCLSKLYGLSDCGIWVLHTVHSLLFTNQCTVYKNAFI